MSLLCVQMMNMLKLRVKYNLYTRCLHNIYIERTTIVANS